MGGNLSSGLKKREGIIVYVYTIVFISGLLKGAKQN